MAIKSKTAKLSAKPRIPKPARAAVGPKKLPVSLWVKALPKIEPKAPLERLAPEPAVPGPLVAGGPGARDTNGKLVNGDGAENEAPSVPRDADLGLPNLKE